MEGGMGFSFSFGAAVGSGAHSRYYEQCLERFEEPLNEASIWLEESAKMKTSGFGWYNLPEQSDEEMEEILEVARWLKGYDAIIHVGIGGSSLGNLMLHQSLLPMYYNELPPSERGPRFYLADNPDPDKAFSIWERASTGRVALIGVSKSGATAETMSQFLWFKLMMERRFACGATDDILVITDPKEGVFRAFAETTGCRSLAIPPSVGGRYSVLSPCGLVTAEALGADAKCLLRGAREMKEYLSSAGGIGTNPARRLAAIHRFHERAGRPMAVMMPYANRLELFAEWFAQLWGESIGKNGLGTTPVRALGAIDQHSQVQLYTAGPDDKFYTILHVRSRPDEVLLPDVCDASLQPLSYLSGHGLGVMLGYEARSTAAALVKAGRPMVWIEMDGISERTVGALVFFYEYVTALTGRLMKIDPFDQPGVEQGKRYTYGMMGRASFSEDAKEAEAFFSRIVCDRLEA